MLIGQSADCKVGLVSSLPTVAEFVKLTQSIVIEIQRQSADLYKVQLCNRQFFVVSTAVYVVKVYECHPLDTVVTFKLCSQKFKPNQKILLKIRNGWFFNDSSKIVKKFSQMQNLGQLGPENCRAYVFFAWCFFVFVFVLFPLLFFSFFFPPFCLAWT